jgi:hypothetical protein
LFDCREGNVRREEDEGCLRDAVPGLLLDEGEDVACYYAVDVGYAGGGEVCEEGLAGAGAFVVGGWDGSLVFRKGRPWLQCRVGMGWMCLQFGDGKVWLKGGQRPVRWFALVSVTGCLELVLDVCYRPFDTEPVMISGGIIGGLGSDGSGKTGS